ncbi:outer membrane beta-barrel protein [Shewanella violacea]|uniref:Outer membrane protein beta-barrel domain-containing protein n=1 Tax=Shewanella violacea (strain JCM 10179 / CIP 106290 / LMG 19151 / DSS12) TaxID=637905 RepID=D4ZF78_SHEVD|nr:outer membrane beta-barrel protein [Shewanella violacea]BAJ04242.1 conserved hypothetical protein [Shewanella violacea DSS12]
MTKYLMLLGLLAISLHASANQLSEESTPDFKAKVSISADYIPATNDMYGITIAPYHFDKNYNQWGYYLGYAQSTEDDISLIKPAEGYTQDTMWRFGLSYSLTTNFSIYSGASIYEHETHQTSGVAPKIVDGKPIWEETSDTTWGGELGLRYMMDTGLMLSTGYNSASESAVISVGWAM